MLRKIASLSTLTIVASLIFVHALPTHASLKSATTIDTSARSDCYDPILGIYTCR